MNCRNRLTDCLVFFVLVSVSSRIYAQDDHYWAQQYGAVSTLMGGAMVGGVTDNSAVYYNPGSLAFISNPSLSVDANVYKMDKIRISDGAGKDMNLNSAQLSVYPQIIAGMINLLKNSKFRFLDSLGCSVSSQKIVYFNKENVNIFTVLFLKM